MEIRNKKTTTIKQKSTIRTYAKSAGRVASYIVPILKKTRRHLIDCEGTSIDGKCTQQTWCETMKECRCTARAQSGAKTIDEPTIGDPFVPFVRAQRSHLQLGLDDVLWISHQPTNRACRTHNEDRNNCMEEGAGASV